MTRRHVATCLLALALGLAPAVGRAQSGFMREQGGVFAKLTGLSFGSRSYYTLDGVLRDRGERLSQRALALYAELGATPWLNLVVDGSLLKVNAFSNSESVAGIGDFRVEAKLGRELGGWHGAVFFGPEIPTGRATANADIDGSPGSFINLPTGDGEWNFWSRLAVSRSLNTLAAYISAHAAFNLRTKGFAHQLGYAVEAGHHFLGRVWLKVGMRQLFSLSDGTAAASFLYGNGTEFLAFDAEAAVPIWEGFGVAVNYTNIAARRRNIYGGSLFGVGVFASF